MSYLADELRRVGLASAEKPEKTPAKAADPEPVVLCPVNAKRRYETKKAALADMHAAQRCGAWSGTGGKAFWCLCCSGWHLSSHRR